MSPNTWLPMGTTTATLLVLVCVCLAGVRSDDDEPQLDPHAPSVCRRNVRESKWVFTNVSMSCWRTEYTDPPCRPGYWRSSDYDDWRRHRRHHHHGHHGRKKRQIGTTSTTASGSRSTHWLWPWGSSYTTTSTSAGSSGHWPQYLTTARLSSYERPYFWSTTTTTPGPPRDNQRLSTTNSPRLPDTDERSEGSRDSDRDQCCRRVRDTCWIVRAECLWVYTTQYFCCPGYEPDGRGGCARQVECSSSNGGCDQICRHDDVRGHHCSCFHGYELVDEKHCVDIDECLVDNGGCNHECTNLAGGYYCSCRSGYMLSDPHTCTEIDECSMNNGGCDHICRNTDGGFYCECEEGFDSVNGSMCEDFDECTIGNGGCSHICTNEYGGYSCDCPEGLLLDTEGYTCLQDSVTTTAQDPNSLPVSMMDKMSDPVVYGSLIGALILLALLVVLLALCLRRYRRRSQDSGGQAIKNGTAFVVGTKKLKKQTLDVRSELGEKPPMGYDAESVNFDDMFDADDYDTDSIKKTKIENDYTDPPSLYPYGSEVPPPYSTNPPPFKADKGADDDKSQLAKSYEKPATVMAETKGYTNLSFKQHDEGEGENPGHVDSQIQNNDEEPVYDDVEVPTDRSRRPEFVETLQNLRNTGRLESLQE